MLPNAGSGGLTKEGVDLIALKVNFQGSKGQKNVKLGYFATLWQFYQTRRDNASLYCVYSCLGMILSRNGFY